LAAALDPLALEARLNWHAPLRFAAARLWKKTGLLEHIHKFN
jgi:hypothetical protein